MSAEGEKDPAFNEEGVMEPLRIGGLKDIMKFLELAKRLITGNDLELTVKKLPKAADAANCSVDGDGLKDAEVDIPAKFELKACDNEGRPLTHGDIPVAVTVKGPSGEECPAEVHDNGDGTYDIEYTPKEPGPHAVEVKVDDTPVKDTPATVDVAPPTPDAAYCTASGPGVEGPAAAGEPAPFTIKARNRIGNPLKVGGHKFTAVVNPPKDVEGAKPIEVAITDNGDGTYSAEYTPAVPGTTLVTVAVEGQQIKDSPFTVEVGKNAGQPDPAQTYAFGPGVEGGCDTAAPATFTIQTVTPSGEKLATGGAQFAVAVKDAEGNDVPATVTDNGDGTYAGEYQPKLPGKYTVNVDLVNPQDADVKDPIKDSPFAVEILPGIDASKCVCEGPGLQSGEVEDTGKGEFKIIAKDVLGNPITTGGEPFQVVVEQPDKTPLDTVQVKDNGDGTYDVSYEPKTDGPHVVSVTLKDAPVAQSPYTVDIVEGADNESTGLGWFGFSLQARTRKGEPLTHGGARFEVVVKLDEHGSKPLENVTVTDHQNGTYSAEYKIDEPGVYKIKVKLNGRRVKGTPFKQHAF